MRVAASQTVETGQPFTLVDQVHGPWLTVHKADSKPCCSASFTYLTTDLVPIVRKLSDGRYEIAFTSEIAKSLP